jgi:uncharacterized delta-60 repeat protein
MLAGLGGRSTQAQNTTNILAFAKAGETVIESEGVVNLMIVRKEGSRGRILVDVQMAANGTNGVQGWTGDLTVEMVDYELSKTFPVRIFDNPSATNANAAVVFKLANPRVAPGEDASFTPIVPAATGSMTLTVLNNDNPFEFTFSKVNYRIPEGQSSGGLNDTIAVTLGKTPTAAGATGVSVNYQILAIAATETAAGADVATGGTPDDSGSVSAPADFALESGTLTFADDQSSANIQIRLPNDGTLEFNEEFKIVLSAPAGTASASNTGTVTYAVSPQFARVRIPFDSADTLPSGALDQSFNRDNVPPNNDLNPGANGPVNTLLVDGQNRTYLGGSFTAVNATTRSGIARLLSDGALDQTFSPAGVGGGSVNAMALYGPTSPNVGKVLIGGSFAAVNGEQRNGLARLNPSGSLDSSFNIGDGVDGSIYAMASEISGSVIIGGDFQSYDNVIRRGLARLQPNGQLDLTTFQNVTLDGSVFAILVEPQFVPPINIPSMSITNQPDRTNVFVTTVQGASGIVNLNITSYEEGDRVLVTLGNAVLMDQVVNANFTTFTDTNGAIATNFNVLSTNLIFTGSVPSPGNFRITFITDTNSGSGMISGTIRSDAGTKSIYVGGDFQHVNGLSAAGVARFNPDGTLDTSFLAGIGSGADAAVYALAFQNGNQLIVGGAFRFFNNVLRGGITRLQEDGTQDLTFASGTGANATILGLSVAAGVLENYIYAAGDFESFNGTRRRLLTRLTPPGFVDTKFLDSTYNQFAGFPNRNGLAAGGPDGYLAAVGTTPNNDVVVGGLFGLVGSAEDRVGIKPRANVARLLGTSTKVGPGTVQFTEASSGVNENGSAKTINIARENGPASEGNVTIGDAVVFTATSDGAAFAGQDYTATSRAVTIGETAASGTLSVPILDEVPPVIEGNEDFFVTITGVQGVKNLNGEIIRPDVAVSQIVKQQVVILENDIETPKIGFALSEYDVDEDDGTATIEVYRTGSASSRVTVRYAATTYTGTNGPAATVGSDFIGVTNTLVFAPGQTNRFFSVEIRDDAMTEFDEKIALALSNPTGGAALNTNAMTAELNLIDNDLPSGKVDFTRSGFSVTEGQAFVEVVVRRSGGNVGLIAVDYVTGNGTALAGEDYVASTNRLFWNDQDISLRTVRIPIVNDDVVETLENFRVTLVNPSAPGIIGNLHPDTVVTINDNDFFGELSFGAVDFYADEDGRNAVIQVVRQNGRAGEVSVAFATAAVSAVPNTDYRDTNGTLTFLPGETAKSFVVPILDDAVADGSKVVNLTLSSAVNGTLGAVKTARLTILDNESLNIPAGDVEKDFAVGAGANGRVNAIALQNDGPTNALRRIIIAGEFSEVSRNPRQHVARLTDDGFIDTTYANNLLIDGPVRTILATPDGRLVIGGEFSNVDNVPANRLARLNTVGHLDTLFGIGSGANGPVRALAQAFVGTNREPRILVAGGFTAINSVFRSRVALVGNDGKIDVSFDPGQGPDGDVTAVAVQPDGKIIIAGSFALYRGQPRNRVARINLDGSLDETFNAGVGVTGGLISAIAVQNDERILVGGSFTTAGGAERKGIARFNPGGSLDASFNPGTGAVDGVVNSIALQADGNIVVAGSFKIFNGLPRAAITRLLPTGANDLSINFGSGANAAIFSVVSQYDRKLVIGGDFTMVNGFPRNRFARLFGGSVSGSGRVEFFQPQYQVSETTPFVTVVVKRSGGTESAATFDYATQPESGPGLIPAIPGTDYLDVAGTVTFAPGESVKEIQVPILDDNLAEDLKSLQVTISNVIGAAVGRQPVAHIQIVSDDSVFSFSQSAYAVNESVNRAAIFVVRTGDLSFQSSVTVSVTGGSAVNGQDFTGGTTTLTFTPGESTKTVFVPIIDDLVGEGPETVLLSLTVNGPRSFPGVANAILTIDDNDFAPGLFTFEQGDLVVPEDAGLVTINVRRASGAQGAVTIDINALFGTATTNDVAVTNRTLAFKDGETNKTFSFRILQDRAVEAPETVTLQLTNPQGGSGLGPNPNLVVTIADDDLGPGSLDQTFNPEGSDGIVYSIVLQPSGKVVLGGDFSTVNGVSAPRLSRLEADGSIDPNFSVGGGPNGPVYSLSPSGDGSRVTVGGSFRIFNGSDRLNIARILPSGALDSSMSQSAGLNSDVLTVSVQPDTKILVGGKFTVPTIRAARVNSRGSLDVSFNTGLGADGDVYDSQQMPDGSVAIGGAFQTVGGVTRRGVAKLLIDGRVDLGFDTSIGANGIVRRVFPLPDGRVIIGGDFTLVNNTPAPFLARLNTDGSVDSAFGAGRPSGPVYAITRQADGKLLVGGDFLTAGGEPRNHVVRLEADGSLDSTFNAALQIDGIVMDIEAQPDGKILISGSFTKVNGFQRGGIARLNGVEALDPTFRIIETSVKASDLRITFESQAGQTYKLYGADSLELPVTWSVIADNIQASGDTTQVSVEIPSGTLGYKFFLIGRANP